MSCDKFWNASVVTHCLWERWRLILLSLVSDLLMRTSRWAQVPLLLLFAWNWRPLECCDRFFVHQNIVSEHDISLEIPRFEFKFDLAPNLNFH